MRTTYILTISDAPTTETPCSSRITHESEILVMSSVEVLIVDPINSTSKSYTNRVLENSINCVFTPTRPLEMVTVSRGSMLENSGTISVRAGVKKCVACVDMYVCNLTVTHETYTSHKEYTHIGIYMHTHKHT